MEFVQVGSIFAGHRIDAVIGQGGMGIVYRATHLGLDREVALKVISPALASDPSFRERFKRESRTAGRLNHPHIVRIYDAGEDQSLLYITMELVEGSDLRDLIRERGRLSESLSVDLINQIGEALDAAHSRGLVHRDVKPANVLVQRKGADIHAFLTDFGLTRHVTSAGGITRTGQWVGTLDYVAPEQIQGETVNPGADTYALACVLFESLAGEVPFPRDNDVAKMWAQVNEDPPLLTERVPKLNPELAKVVRRAMSKDPTKRYETTGEFAVAARESLQKKPRGLRKSEDDSGRTRISTKRAGAAATGAGAAKGGDRGDQTREHGKTDLQDTKPLTPETRRRWWGLVAILGVLALVAGVLIGGGGNGSDSATASSANLQLDHGPEWNVYLGSGGVEGLNLADPVALDLAELNGLGVLRAGKVTGAEPGDDPLPQALRDRFNKAPEREFLSINDNTWIGYRGMTRAESGRSSLFVAMLPTNKGYQGFACEAPVVPPVSFEQQCDGVASTLRLKDAEAVDPGPDPELAKLFGNMFETLSKVQNSAAKGLRADSSDQQAKAARRISEAYKTQAEKLDEYTPRPQDVQAVAGLQNSLKNLSTGYGNLAKAAEQENSGAYSRARDSIRQANRQYRKAIAALRANGYEI